MRCWPARRRDRQLSRRWRQGWLPQPSLRGAARYRLTPTLQVGASGFAFRGKSEFDGFDPVTFAHADTLDETHNKLSAGRLVAEVGRREKSYGVAYASLLGSSNRNDLGDEPVNRTEGRRRTFGLEGGTRFGKHQLIGALESEREEFKASDTAFGGFTNQDRSTQATVDYCGVAGQDLGPVTADLAVRQDFFSRFKNATTIVPRSRSILEAAFPSQETMAKALPA